MQKAIKSILMTLLFLFAGVGVVASGLLLREVYLESRYEKLYIRNCHKVKAGMTLEEAKVAMGGSRYYEHLKSFSYETTFEKGKPTAFLLTYPTSGASYTVAIEYDPTTGLVKEVECSGY
ncbi:hypothetical protein GU926_12705 [Nibribacter ruber]|uniref:Uncharacterized protein n=1 Tax=Nibribacter ruber TaxID=2698458 RepID=A0A6P1P1T8_9BACT|nr:hypothetical protein [Nibribacter ruber]QHL88243.1 hypothetical protein GU926_12705 [Nibribacter ruber]